MAKQANPGQDNEQAYTMQQALKDAAEMLRNQFGDVEQGATVSLATFLYGVHARDEFLREHDDARGEMAYGGAPTR